MCISKREINEDMCISKREINKYQIRIGKHEMKAKSNRRIKFRNKWGIKIIELT